ncbi:glycosyltransferase family 2 protein [Gorillibacterium massiliense]|uniref:glycosyltransferase family 2 protein n=1 Tax=Gorillibacterium massiliense TaxID=1280390 RepID=UPI0004B85415|nr:glycosyltransferase [Gorillibacterium massiliense]
MISYSIVIPTYNNKRLLANTLEALNYQTGFDPGSYEVLVVDDGSDDETEAFIRDIPSAYAFTYLYIPRSANSCRARVRNAGWKQAKGRFILFLDSDIVVAPDYLADLDRYFQRNPDLLVCSFRYMLRETINQDELRSGELFRRNFQTLEYLEARHFDCMVSGFNVAALKIPWQFVFSCSMALSREHLNELGGFDEGYMGWGMEDTDIGYRAHHMGLPIVCHMGMTALHQFHGEAFGDLKSYKKMQDWDINITRMYRIYPELQRELPRRSVNIAYFTRRVAQMLMRKENKRSNYVIEVREKAEIPDAKELISALAAKRGYLIIVQDESEDADFHLWIQLLGYTESEIRYFPRSFQFERQAVRRYHKSVFSIRRSFLLIYRCLKLVIWKLEQRVRHEAAQP